MQGASEPIPNSETSHAPLETESEPDISEFEYGDYSNSDGDGNSMVVIFPPRKNASGTGISLGFRHHTHRRYLMWLAGVTVLCATFMITNHIREGMLPKPNGVSIQKHPKSEGTSTSNNGAPDPDHPHTGEKSQPVMVRDNKLPTTITPFIPLHAAEALQCRDSVVNFVINATDAKDECEGLKKAFDKTCGALAPDPAPVPQEAVSTAKKQPMHRFGERRAQKFRKSRTNNFVNRRKPEPPKKWRAKRQIMQHRRLSEKVNYSVPDLRKWRLWLYETRRVAYDLYKYWFGIRKDFLFAEDEILRVWSDAQNLVANDLDEIAHADLIRRWEVERRRRWWKRRLEETEEADSSNTSLTPVIKAPVINQTKPINLALPTMLKHVSGEMINDVLMLHKGEKLGNQTIAPAQDANESSNAKSNKAAEVSSIPDEPTALEIRTCCTSILNVYHENCSIDDEEQFSDRRLLFIVLVMALCGMVKSLIRHYRILWLPEAAGCIIVGILVGYVLVFFPHQDISFDGHWFLRIMVPPIIFEAALSIDKRSFNRYVVPILLYAVVGTLMASFITAEIIHRSTTWLHGWITPIPYVESLAFGALISSIDPIAVLSVLSNMGLSDKDAIYVLIFGESLLNDGVAIVLFDTLVHFLDERLIIDNQAVVEASIHFSVVALGSIMVGAVAGYTSTIYFWLFQGCQTPLVEVLMFFCWALVPYYVCDGIGWSGIVSTVATGMVMDIHVVGVRKEASAQDEDSEVRPAVKPIPALSRDFVLSIFSNPDGHLSAVARAHIGFVTGMIATTLETAIFAYLGLFLFSHRYHWSCLHSFISILACCVSRGIMIPFLTFVVNLSGKVHQTALSACGQNRRGNGPILTEIDSKMQFVLWFAGLRGAMSFALVESVPLYDSGTGEGTRLKPELKAMTSACIMFTVFVLGGYTYYVMEYLGMAPSSSKDAGATQLQDEQEPESLQKHKEAKNGSPSIAAPTNRRRPRPAS